MRWAALSICLLFCSVTQSLGDEQKFRYETSTVASQNFVRASILGIFYHELGHALIDVLRIPIFGQEEDAADVAAIYMIDMFFENDVAERMAYDYAFSYRGDDAMSRATLGDDYELPYWDVHGLNLQRYYNMVCLFYGANPDEREDFAAELLLPDERAETCEEEFILTDESWGPVFDELADAKEGKKFDIPSLDSDSEAGDFTWQILEEELAAINEAYTLPEQVGVHVEDCNMVNAFYIPSQKAIVMCTELTDYLAYQYNFLTATSDEK